jgi:deoxyribodipyrimidine photo-lyase
VYTPYSRKWKNTLSEYYLKPYPSESYFSAFHRFTDRDMPSLGEMGFTDPGIPFPPREIPLDVVRKYAERRDLPAVAGTSRLSLHLRFGTVSIRKLASTAQQTSEKWLNELIWRDFYQAILYHFPHTAEHAFKPAYDRIPWRNDSEGFRRWCEGKTGYPLVDAGMRELNATGFMHNRVRMVVASFLTKHLLINWRLGERYFASKLLDFELASNVGGWQWAAGSGCDAAPYFRVFNPQSQQEKFDPQFVYIRKWVPEFGTPAYPKPMVSHPEARERCLTVFKEALREG